MNAQQNQLGQYTVPTTPKEQAFYSRHSGAIKRYTIAIVLIQLAWSFFSYNPALSLLMENTTLLPAIQPYLPLLVGGILAMLHFVLKSETLETFSNIMDKDETTINGWWNYLIPILVCVGLFILDLKGVSTTFRDKSFDGKKKEVGAESQKALDKAKADYISSLLAIASTRKDDSTATVSPFASQLSAADRMVQNDAQDRAIKSRKINSIKSARSEALSSVLKESSEAQKKALLLYNTEKARITGKLDSAHASLDGQDNANAIKADNYSWIVSAFFLVLFLLMNYKLVYLRVNSGIKVNVEFTQLDAEGSFLEKLQRVVLSILQRQGHRFLVFCHKIGSKGTATLSTFDGRVILQQSSYNGSTDAKQRTMPNNPTPPAFTFSKSSTPSVAAAANVATSFKPYHTTEATASHEAGHVCMSAYLATQLGIQTYLVELSIQPIRLDENSTSYGRFKCVPYTLEATERAINLQLMVEMAGYAAEYIICFSNENIDDFISNRQVPTQEGTDNYKFEHLKKRVKELKDVTYQQYIKHTVRFFQKENTMLQRVTSDLIAKREITGAEAEALWNSLVVFYGGTPTPSVAAVKSAMPIEKKKVKDKYLLASHIYNLKYNDFTDSQKANCFHTYKSFFPEIPLGQFESVMTSVNPEFMIFNDDSVHIIASEGQRVLDYVKTTTSPSVQPVQPAQTPQLLTSPKPLISSLTDSEKIEWVKYIANRMVITIKGAAEILERANPEINPDAPYNFTNEGWKALGEEREKWEKRNPPTPKASDELVDFYEYEKEQDVYTAYIRGYIKVGENDYRNPTQFINLIRNAYTRKYAEKVALRREQLLKYLDDNNVTAEIIRFCRDNEDIIGHACWCKFKSIMGGPNKEVIHE